MKQKSLSNLFIVFATLWIIGVFFKGPSEEYKIKMTQEIVKESVLITDLFYKTFQRLPHDLGEIRTFARSKGKLYSPYDVWGTRLTYKAFDHQSYYIKSFGPEKVEGNIALDQTITYAKFQYNTGEAIDMRKSRQSFIIYPAIALEGIKSPNKHLTAELKVDNHSQQRSLVVRSLKKHNFIISAFHDRVSEFLWLPNSEEIVFTAEQTERYSQGLYLWNLRTGHTINLLKDSKNTYFDPKSTLINIALSTTQQTKNARIIHFYAASSDFRYGLSPQKLFAPYNRYSLIGPMNDKQKWSLIRNEKAPSVEPWTKARASEFHTYYSGNLFQKDWMQLPHAGGIEETLHAWQQFSGRSTDSPLFAYSLWWLCALYWDAYAAMSDTNQKEALVLRNFGIEISEALESLSIAPKHIREMAKNIRSRMMNRQKPPQRLFELEF